MPMAYHAVATSVEDKPKKKKKTEWPNDLKLYVARAFEHVDDCDRSALEDYLKSMITRAFESSTVWTTNWALEPLPQLGRTIVSIESQRPQSMQSSISSVASISDTPAIPSKRKKSRFDIATAAADASLATDAQKAKRAKRFEEDSALRAASLVSAMTPPIGFSEGVPDYDEHTIVGHATKLEKSYLRLTSAPDPGTVRPLHILKETLELLKRKWKENANYAYICDQFKSLRQDLTVQRIKNDFTITVYEIHARIALEKADLGEYNQCQTQLQTLYNQIPGTGRPLEFLAYRILYMLHTRNLTEVNTVLVNLTPALRQDSSIAHALAVRKALACNNYPRLFRLYLEAPNMSGYLMDNFVNRERISALAIICRGCRPTLELDTRLARTLGFIDVGELLSFLTDLGDETLLACITEKLDKHESNQSATDGSQQPSFLIDPKKAGDVFESKKRAMGGVDIKGQI